MKHPLEILVIEDHYIMRKFLETFLSKNHIVYCKNNGMEAIRWLESGNRPHIIVVDLSMPELDGKEFIKYIKSTEFFADIPTIIVSGSEESEIINVADDYLLKPFNPNELEEKIQKLIKKPVSII